MLRLILVVLGWVVEPKPRRTLLQLATSLEYYLAFLQLNQHGHALSECHGQYFSQRDCKQIRTSGCARGTVGRATRVNSGSNLVTGKIIFRYKVQNE